MKERRETASESVPTSSENLCKSSGGWNRTQTHEGKGIEGDFSPQKTETNPTAILKMDESLVSTNTQTTEKNLVPATPENLYENEVGCNTNQSQTGQGIEGDFLPRKNEPTILEIQDCLKELRQVKTADDYWQLYEQKSQLVTSAWHLLRTSEQLRIQQICDEGVDPLAKWKEGD
jgi:hypothetical protein